VSTTEGVCGQCGAALDDASIVHGEFACTSIASSESWRLIHIVVQLPSSALKSQYGMAAVDPTFSIIEACRKAEMQVDGVEHPYGIYGWIEQGKIDALGKAVGFDNLRDYDTWMSHTSDKEIIERAKRKAPK
jgi:hypothetical protein